MMPNAWVRARLRWWRRCRSAPAAVTTRQASEGMQTLTVRGKTLRVCVRAGKQDRPPLLQTLIVGRDITGLSAFT